MEVPQLHSKHLSDSLSCSDYQTKKWNYGGEWRLYFSPMTFRATPITGSGLSYLTMRSPGQTPQRFLLYNGAFLPSACERHLWFHSTSMFTVMSLIWNSLLTPLLTRVAMATEGADGQQVAWRQLAGSYRRQQWGNMTTRKSTDPALSHAWFAPGSYSFQDAIHGAMAVS